MSEISGDREVLINQLKIQKFEIEQSLRYASYIQSALFPKNTDLKQIFPESFIFFKPKDIVSGDFYWVHHKQDTLIVAVGDCTGHGVPGAFISILGISLLNLIISKFNPETAGMTLNLLREHVMSSLDQTGREEEQKDGIDMSLCMINYKENVLQYAGAFNPMYIVRDGNINQIKCDKMPIGVAAGFEKSFKNNVYNLEKNDMLYLFTDGFPDQFGGKEHKKYKYPNFRKLLVECSKKPIEIQKNLIDKEFFNWKGDLPQLDDTTIIGIRNTY